MSRSLFYVSVGWAAAVLAGGAGVSVQGQNPGLALSLFVLAMLSGSLVAVLLVAANLEVRSSTPREGVAAADHTAVLGRLERISPVAEDGIVAEAQPASEQPVVAVADLVSADDEPAAREALIDALLALRGEQLLDAVEVIASSTPLVRRPTDHEPDIPAPGPVPEGRNVDQRPAPATEPPASRRPATPGREQPRRRGAGARQHVDDEIIVGSAAGTGPMHASPHRTWHRLGRLARAHNRADPSSDPDRTDEIIFGRAGDDGGATMAAEARTQGESSEQTGS
jgi:outer membrane biosynthesis protein TonB